MKSLLLSLVIFMISFCVLLGQSKAAQDGLVGYWKFDEGDGEDIEDSSGAGNHGVLVGNVGWVDGKFGGALEFTEDQSCVKIEHSESINLTDAITIALWAKPEASQPSWGKFMCKQKTGEYPYSLQYDDGGKIFGTINAAARFDTPHLDNFADWSHLAYVYDGEAGILYLNGEETGRIAANGDLQQNDLELTIGSRLDSEQSYKGILDDVRLYNRALSQDEIKRVMEGGDSSVVSASGKLAITWGMIKK